jgi:glycosyltransferase involved in cell wall biosynthesis
MYPTPAEPDLGAFIQQIERELVRQGHEVELAAIGQRGGSKTKYLSLLRDAVRRARRSRPDVIWGHFLAPAGAIAAVASRASGVPLVLMAHGRDVRNVGVIPGIRAATRFALRRANALIVNSGYLGRELAERIGGLPPTEVIDLGVDTERFSPAPRAEGEGPRFVFVGTLDERKNVVRLAEAFRLVGRGSLTLVGDGPLRGSVEGLAGVTVTGRIPNSQVPGHVRAADVLCLPSLIEPFGQVLLEAMACGRPVVATGVGGPPEFVPEGGGEIVDPEDVDAIAAGMERAAALPVPNDAAIAAAREHGVDKQASRIAAVLQRAAA